MTKDKFVVEVFFPFRFPFSLSFSFPLPTFSALLLSYFMHFLKSFNRLGNLACTSMKYSNYKISANERWARNASKRQQINKNKCVLDKKPTNSKNKEKERGEGIKSNHRKRKIRFRKCLKKQKSHHRLRLNFSNLRKSPSKATDFIESLKFKEWYER